MTAPFLSTALDFAAQGYSIFPCKPATKKPATRHGFKDGTSNPATIRRWWLANDTYNIGVATGLRSGVWIFDVDGPDGAATLRDLELAYGSLPPTRISITAHGCHFWFCAAGKTPSSTGRIGTGLDVRAEGGYVLAPPSIHPDGPRYRWANIRTPAIAPDWLLSLTQKQPKQTITQALRVMHPPAGILSGYGKAALEREIGALANTPPGARNHALNRASFSLHQLVAGGELDGAEVHARLIDAAHANGLMADPDDGPVKVERTIRSGAQAGLQLPRSRRAS